MNSLPKPDAGYSKQKKLITITLFRLVNFLSGTIHKSVMLYPMLYQDVSQQYIML